MEEIEICRYYQSKNLYTTKILKLILISITLHAIDNIIPKFSKRNKISITLFSWKNH